MTARQLRKARRAAERSEQKSTSNQAGFVSQRSRDEQDEPAFLSEAKTQNGGDAAHSTSPRTLEGKARSSQNSLQHGLYSKQVLLSWEDPSEFQQLRDALLNEHRPATPTEELLVAEITENFWRIRRFRCIEAQFLGAEHFDASLIAAVQRSLAAAERGFHKALAILRQLQKERGFVPQSAAEPAPEITSTTKTGFVSQNPPSETKSRPLTASQTHSKAA